MKSPLDLSNIIMTNSGFLVKYGLKNNIYGL